MLSAFLLANDLFLLHDYLSGQAECAKYSVLAGTVTSTTTYSLVAAMENFIHTSHWPGLDICN